MNPVLEFLLPYVVIYKYVAIFIITFLGAFALPLPSGSMLTAASAFAVRGDGGLQVGWIFAVGLAGNLAGDNAGYWVVRLYGLQVLERLGLGRFFKPAQLEGARQKLHDHPIMAIYSTRFLTALAPAVNVAAGLSRLSYKRYLLFESLGELTEVTFFCLLGWLFGNNWEYISGLSGWFLVIIFASMIGSYFIWKKVFLKE
jgi:membrane-associated protein